MLGLLGNKNGVVKPWYLPFDFVFCRVKTNGKMVTVIIKNDCVKNVYGLVVVIHNGRILHRYEPPDTGESGAA